tara:strand:+ start:111 stop:350 length:240 start_codon:yes stop_codon:yes gene_type:complete
LSNHWITKKENIRKLWIWLIFLLICLVVAQFVLPISGHFLVESWIGFAAWFGFISCIVMILFAKILGILVKKSEDYYEK